MKSSNGSNLHRLIRFDDARTIDEQTIAAGNSEVLLMGLAAQGALRQLKGDFLANDPLDNHDTDIVIVCGSGNNGGDGLALASLLYADPDWPVSNLDAGLPSFSSPKRPNLRVYAKLPMRSDAAKFYESKLRREKIEIHSLADFSAELNRPQPKALILIEALLGTGQSKPPADIILESIKTMKRLTDTRKKNNYKTYVIALDVPCGLTEDKLYTQQDSSSTESIRPDTVYTFGNEKLATSLMQGLPVTQIGCGFESHIVNKVFAQPNNVATFRNQSIPLDNDAILPFFQRQPDDHKYKAGYGWSVCGDLQMEGAGLLVSRSFFSSGGGYLRHFHSASLSRQLYLSAMPSALYADIGQFQEACGNEKPPRSVLIGPGMTASTIRQFGANLIEGLSILANRTDKLTLILDAAACTLAFDYAKQLADTNINILITPHAAEWQSLGAPHLSASGINDGYQFLQRNHLRLYAYVKGPVSVLFTPNHVQIINQPQPQLAVAGSGDLLSGLLLRAFCGHKHDAAVHEVVAACLSLQYKTSMKSMHPESQLHEIQARLI